MSEAPIIKKASGISIVDNLTTDDSNSALSVRQGKELNDYFNRGGMLPTGTVVMFNGSDWIDNVTMNGWYACVSGNVGFGVPALEDKFVMGCTSTDIGNTGGSGEVALSQEHIPQHSHDYEHGHTQSPGSNNQSPDAHTHTYKAYNTINNAFVWFNNLSNWMTITTARGTQGSPNHTNHNTAVNIPAVDQDSGSTGTGTNVNNLPAYQSLIYIKKVT